MARKKKEKSISTIPDSWEISTKPENTGVSLKNGNKEGLSVLVELTEQVQIEQDHDINIESISFKGMLNVKNPSLRDRVWDITFELNNVENTNLDSKFEIKELGIEENDNKFALDFQITGEKRNLLLVKEYINTSPAANETLNLKDIERHLLSLKDKKSEVEAIIIEEPEETVIQTPDDDKLEEQETIQTDMEIQDEFSEGLRD
ncbi:MAG: hypothetical protein ACFFAS_05780 [Promethearchaeota archaeon]